MINSFKAEQKIFLSPLRLNIWPVCIINLHVQHVDTPATVSALVLNVIKF